VAFLFLAAKAPSIGDTTPMNEIAITLDNIEQHNDEALQTFAREELGLTINANFKRDTVIRKIREAMGGADSATTADTGDRGVSETAKNIDAALEEHADAKRILIKIPKEKGPMGTDDVQVRVNGKQYLIKRDVEVAVPPSVLEALRNAIETQYNEDEDPVTGKRVQIAIDTPSYPVHILGAAA
jgi:hypothetical protein